MNLPTQVGDAAAFECEGFPLTQLQNAMYADACSWCGHCDSQKFPKRALLSGRTSQRVC